MKCVFLLMTVICVTSCHCDRGMKKALGLAGENKVELENVLAHYSRDKADSLKLRAAVFLIENMPGHYTIEYNSQEKVEGKEAGLYFSRKYLDIIMPFYQSDIIDGKKEDVTNISSEFLIRHIDAAFEQYNTYPWLEKFPFNLFLEYLLPYRFVNERLDYWRDSLHMTDQQVEMIRYYDDIKYLPAKISDFFLPQSMRLPNKSFIISAFGHDITGDCYSLIVQELIKCRAIGIPSAIDFMPGYGNRNGYHYWITYMSPEVKTPEKRYLAERKAPKIYRITYSPNKVHKGKYGEYIPELFRNPFIKDVTDLFAHTRDITIRNLRKLDMTPNYAYLCVFNSLGWLPVAIGEYGRKSVKFEDVGEDLIYLPVAYSGENTVVLNYPFILYRNGETEHLVPDTTVRQKIALTRKYPSNMTLSGMIKDVDGSYWSVSDNPDFVRADTAIVYRASGYMLNAENKQDNTPSTTYRYWKFTPRQSPLTLAELMFFDQNGRRLDVMVDESFKNLFDNDPLTNATIEGDLIVDLGIVQAVSKIVCIPRTDGNGIVPGNHYELFYHDLGGWKSLGKRIADDTYLEYNNVPADALLWLRNYTTGIEERIFTYKDGVIRFW